MSRLKKKFIKEVLPKLKKDLGLSNDMTVPKLEKVVLNSGTGQALADAKFLEVVADDLTIISGQKSVRTKAKKSISNFKIRKGMIVGVKVTLRGERMYDFVDKLVNVALPRVRDFRGLPRTGFDGCGNYSLGIEEQMVFPEIDPNKTEKVHGLDISIITTATDDKSAAVLLKYLGFPFQKN